MYFLLNKPMAKGEIPNKVNSDPTAPKQEGLAFSFGGLAAVFRAKANLAKNEIKIIKHNKNLMQIFLMHN